MNPLYISGKIIEISEPEQISEKFRKATLVIETYENYPQRVQFQAVNDKVDILADLQEDQTVNVFFNIRSNEWNGKLITNLNLWKVEDPSEVLTGQKSKKAVPKPAAKQAPKKSAPKPVAKPIDEDFLSGEDSFDMSYEADDDDIPF